MKEGESVAEAAARLQTESESLRFECEMLRREAGRLIGINRALEARVALADSERDRLRHYVTLINHSLPWRLVQTVRGWIGRRW